MKNFDSDRATRPRRPVEDRTFVIGGETFVARDRFRPDALTHIEDLRQDVTDPVVCQCRPADATSGHRRHEHVAGPCSEPDCDCKKFREKVLQEGATFSEQIAAVDRTIVDLLEGADAEARWLAVRANQDDPLVMEDMMGLIRWMTEGDTARPTGAPGASTPGRESTETSSTGDSSSPGTLAA